MKILDLPLKGKWYNMYEAGIKKEEYREVNKYWNRRLFRCLTDAPGRYGNCQTITDNGVETNCHCLGCDMSEHKGYTHVRLRYGYTKRTMLFELKDIKKGVGNPDWGAPYHEVFILKLGDRIE